MSPVGLVEIVQLNEIFERLNAHFGPQHWWPAETTVEMVVGAVLTQNTNWKNVEKSIASLKGAGLLSFSALSRLPETELANHIRASGYFRVKARRLQNLLAMIAEDYHGDLQALLSEPTATARRQLLGVSGIGPETADSILLYGGGHPIFVVDAYTHRILVRHNLVSEEAGYPEIQDLFMDGLAPDTDLFKQYHALLVKTGKVFCKKREPRCDACPLREMLPSTY